MADGQHGLVGRDTTGDDPASVLSLNSSRTTTIASSGPGKSFVFNELRVMCQVSAALVRRRLN